jgi:hypothetical protein
MTICGELGKPRRLDLLQERDIQRRQCLQLIVKLDIEVNSRLALALRFAITRIPRVSGVGKSIELFFGFVRFGKGCLIGHHLLNKQSGGHYAGSLGYHTKKKIGKDSI